MHALDAGCMQAPTTAPPHPFPLSPQVARLDLSRFLESSVASWAEEAQATAAQMEGNGNGAAAAEVRTMC